MSLFCCFGSGQEPKEQKSSSLTATSDNSAEDWSFDQDEGEDYQRNLWQQVISEKSQMLATARRRQLQLLSSRTPPTSTAVLPGSETDGANGSVDMFMQRLTTLYGEHGFSKRMPLIREIFNNLQPFVVAVNTLVQTNTVAALVWGSVSLVFQSVLRFASFWDDLGIVFRDIGRALPRFHGYIQVLHTPRLHASLRAVYSKFLDICMMTLNTLQSDRCYLMLRIQWSSFAFELSNASQDLSIANTDFEKEAQLAHVQESSKRHNELLGILKSQQARPHETVKTNIKLSRNENFKGRDDTLALLHSYLEPDSNKNTAKQNLSSCLIHAIGGMGKTEVALEYTYRFRDYYSHIFWLPSQSEVLLQEAFLAVVSKLSVAADRSANLQVGRMIELGLEWFETTVQSWLLVFDNAENVSDLKRFWPASTRGAILVTSQNPAFRHTTKHSILLGPMSASEGSNLIQAYLRRGRSEQLPAEELCVSLGGLPLAIVHFTGYVARSNCPIEHISHGLADRLRGSHAQRMSSDISDSRLYEYTLATVWKMALRRLSDDAMILLQFIAFLDPDDIPVALFIGDIDTSDDSGVAAISKWEYWDLDRYNEAVSMLCERHLVSRTIQPGIDSIRTHRALQMTVLQELHGTPTTLQDRFNEVVAIVRRATPVINVIKRSNTGQFLRFAKYLPQTTSLHSVFVSSEGKIAGPIVLATLLDDTGYYAFTRVNYIAASAFSETGATICTNINNREANHVLANILPIKAQMFNLRGVQGWGQALEMMYRVLELRKEAVEGVALENWTELQSVNFARAHADIGGGLCQKNQPNEAGPFYETAMKIYERLGNTVRHTLVLINQLMVLSTAQRKDGTRTQAQCALRIIAEELEDDSHLATAAMYQAALSYFTIGDVSEALEIMEAVALQNKITLGEGNDMTLSSLYLVSVYSQNSGKLEDAETQLREILEKGQENGLWREEDIMRTKFRLSVVLRAQSREIEAVETQREVNQYLSTRRLPGKEYTDADNMALLDSIVTFYHGRTAGIWSSGSNW